MSGKSIKEYLVQMRLRYKASDTKAEISGIIDEVVTNLGIHRKSAIRALNHKPRVRRKRKARETTYGFDLIKPLTEIWQVAGTPCSKRLKPQIPELINKLEQFNEIKFYGNQKVLLTKMSTFTIDRLLSSNRLGKIDKGLSGTKISPLLKQLIPVRTNFDEINEPGHIEMDCVLNCGTTINGSYAETLNLLDIQTHWNEKSMFLNKNKIKVVSAFDRLRKQFPFDILSIDFDNGNEFVNWKLKTYCDRDGISYTRCRPYKKNDQAHIEGKNYQSVRRVIGYDRIEDQKIVELVEDIYRTEHRLLTNFFYSTMKLEEKVRTTTGRIQKKHGEAKTPYARVLGAKTVSEEVKEKLREEYKKLNPAELQRGLQRKIKKLGKMIVESNNIKSGNA